MRKIIPLLALLPCLSHAISFDSRVDAGYLSSETKEGRDYEASIGLFIGNAMRKCMPTEINIDHSDSDFTYVIWVQNAGEIFQPEVRPHTEISDCFLAEFSKNALPYPPKSAMKPLGYPLTIYMKVTNE